MMASERENYYDILNIKDDASMDEIKKAYKKLAFQYHPDKNRSPGAEEKFKILSRAYNVLSNPKQRRMYDEDRKTGPSGCSFGNSWSGFNEDPRKMFRDMFGDYFNIDDDDFMTGTHQRFTNSSRLNESRNFSTHERSREGNSSRKCEFNQDGFSSFFGRPKRRQEEDFFENGPSMGRKRPRNGQSQSNTEPSECPKDAPIERPLELSLEELSTGCTKKMIIKRTINYDTGGSLKDSKVVEIPVKPGWKAGTRITYQELGDKYPGSIPADITFVVKDKSHAIFTRDNDNNLLHKAKISLKNALLGVSYCIQGLNGKRHNVNINDIIYPGFVKRYPNEGLPLPKTPSKRGDLIVTFDIDFPTHLSWDQRRTLSECLPG